MYPPLYNVVIRLAVASPMATFNMKETGICVSFEKICGHCIFSRIKSSATEYCLFVNHTFKDVLQFNNDNNYDDKL